MPAAIDIDHLRQWIGRSEQSHDHIGLEQARAIAATLDHTQFPQMGDALGPLWHWAFFRPIARMRDMGPDGHPDKATGFLPPVPLPRRMWVGSDLRFHAPVPIGSDVTRKTTITDVTAKSGKGGALVFVTLHHEVSGPQGPAIDEIQNIVYREAFSGSPPSDTRPQPVPGPRAREKADWRDALTPDPVLLLRYSALTFNAHRIHYDLDYARKVEGYPGLVVHGPLSATLLADRAVQHHKRPLKSFTFRAMQPLFAGETLHLCGEVTADGLDLWAETPEGGVAISASATI